MTIMVTRQIVCNIFRSAGDDLFMVITLITMTQFLRLYTVVDTFF